MQHVKVNSKSLRFDKTLKGATIQPLIAVLGALPQEIATLRRRMSVTQRLRRASCLLWEGNYRGQPIILGQLGMGRINAERGTAFVLARYELKALLSVGFCGGLTERLVVGTAGACRLIYAMEENNALTKDPPIECDARLLTIGGEEMSFVGVTTAGILTLPQDKAALGITGAEVVDMESYWVGRLALACGVPFLSLRVVSDSANQAMPPLASLVGMQGQPKVGKILACILHNPGVLAAFMSLAKSAQRAQPTLTALTERVILGIRNA